MTEIKTNPDEFIKFYNALMASAPKDYKPWLFPVVANDKFPDALATYTLAGDKSQCCDANWKHIISSQTPNKSYWACEKCLQARASWKAPHAQMTLDQCVERLKEGGNIGFAARANDPIILLDLDDESVPDIKETLALQSRRRRGRHRIGLAGDDKIKTNINTGNMGELRSLDEYIVAPGSYVPLTQESINKLPEDQKALAGCYTVEKVAPLATLVYDDLPACFKEANDELVKNATQTKVNTFNPSHEFHSKIFDIKVGDFIDINQPRDTHPAHGSDTGANFSSDGNTCICWRHNMAHNAIHLLAVLSGKYECQSVGKKLKGKSIPIDDGQIFWAWHEAKKREIIPDDDPVPVRGMAYVANEYKIPSYKGTNFSVEDYNKILDIIRTEYKMTPGRSYKHKKEIVIPKPGKLISQFAKEIAGVIAPTDVLFYRTDSKDIVEIGNVKSLDTGDITYNGFISMTPSRFITTLENYLVPGIYMKTEDKENGKSKIKFISKSIPHELSKTVLDSDVFQKSLPQIYRMFSVPIPIMYKGQLTFPVKGYDERFGSWLPYDAPEISDPYMELEKAIKIINDIFKEFCFQSKQDYINAVAGLLTPFLRGLFTAFNVRTPVFFYLANRERAGKDYLAGVTGMVYDGFNLEESPISNSEKIGSNSEELRKKILSAMISGRKRLHFANNKGHIDNAVFEAVTTAEKYSDRLLGHSQILTFDNELDFSLSGNIGVGFTPDFANRCKFVRLFLDIENANARRFENPLLHEWILKNRSKILSALYALVRNWIAKGSPKGTFPFTSFNQWADICGGIMEAAGFDNPCKPDEGVVVVAGDNETSEMKKLFLGCHNAFPEQSIKRDDIRRVVEDLELFPWFDLNGKKDDSVKFGILLARFEERILGDVRLTVTKQNDRASRREYRFTRNKKEKSILDFQEYSKLEGVNLATDKVVE
jgi:hypothetical protein